jgi:hypothetical protein
VEEAHPRGSPADENVEDLALAAPGVPDGLEQDAIARLRPPRVGDLPRDASLLADEAAAAIGARRGREGPLDEAIGPPPSVTATDPLEAPLRLQRPQKRPQRRERFAPEAELAQDLGGRQERTAPASEELRDLLRRERRRPPTGRPSAPALSRRPAPLSAPSTPAAQRRSSRESAQ